MTSTPRDDGFFMPAEWTPHQQTWMVWPERADNWRRNARPAQAAFTEVAHAIAAFEPVTVCASPRQYANAICQLGAASREFAIRIVEMASDDAWCRDTGPTFVVNSAGEVRGIDWTFNAWGGLDGGLYAPWENDDALTAHILQSEKLHRYRTEGFVLEGGAIHVDGEGTLITTEECLLNPNRNPHLNRADIEKKLRDCLGVSAIIWLPRGIINDETDGHVDNLCCFVRPGEVLLAWTDDTNDPQHAQSAAALRVLEGSRDASGHAFKIHKLPLPNVMYSTDAECADVKRDAGTRLAASYVNFYLCNGGVVMPAFDDAKDAVAAEILAGCFPGRRVVAVPGREILLGGGNIHCITQQQPLASNRHVGA